MPQSCHGKRYNLVAKELTGKRSPVVFESANWSIRSIIQQFSSTVNSTKTVFFLVLRVRLTDGKSSLYSVVSGVFPVTKNCFHRRFPLKTMRFLPFSRTVNAYITLENHVSSNVHGLVNILKYNVF